MNNNYDVTYPCHANKDGSFEPLPMKGHVFAEMVNELRDCAIKYHDHQSLRERIAYIVDERIKTT